MPVAFLTTSCGCEGLCLFSRCGFVHRGTRCPQIYTESLANMGRFQVFFPPKAWLISWLLNCGAFFPLFLPVSFKYSSWLFPYLGLSSASALLMVFLLKWVQRSLLLHFSKFFILLSQLVQGKNFKLECHPQKNAECFADFCGFRSLGSYNECVVYWMWCFFIPSLNFIYRN